MAETLENQILHALGQVFDHDKDKNIVSLGIVKNINVVDYTKLYRTYDKKNKILNKIEKYSIILNKKIPNYTPKPKKKYTINDFYEIFSN